ncbi:MULTISPECIES: bifunctional sugar phosphate isomerase/epimerase/4-hydroxyphenylpyruvate dioxygenase family protein [Amycolatopsis]|uniref:3-dehydroshikimate dehydratase n=2 Tax=Amycolatopsis TaxID=1813 RepID=A0A1I3RH40_9PSEU|nr:sugar phosphate isomerase/epimerase and 4-hydroxyphenylpyruvate domain-containing protein [Amycolatopsis sacchari]SFJ44607.1 4-hydroxyphenylpyruvate dioxygenase [Amycolatopsis sacchari]
MSRTDRRSIATVCLSGTLEDKLTAAAAAGFDGVEIFDNDLIASPESPAALRKHCEELGLSIELYQPFRDFEAVPPDVLASNLRRAERKFDVMEQLGADTLLVCSTVSPDAVDDDDLAAEQLHLLASRAAERGIRIAYEALAWGRFVNTYDHSWRIVRRADHPALGLCLDSFHILSRGTDLAGIRTIPASKLFFLQLADAPRLDMNVLQWSRHYRLFPGQGSFDLPGFLRAVLAAGYDGPLSLEVFNDVFRQADPRPAAVDAMRSLVSLQEAVGHTDIPAPPELAGHSFVELSAAGPETAATLAALGLTHAGQHRSKPVQLWQQGNVRVLLNSADASGGTRIGAIAVDSADPAASADRAEKLLAPKLPREHRADEADLTAVEAPDGTAVFLTRTDAWLADFTPVDGPRHDTGLTGIDHVALTQPFDHFDGAALFYRSVLGLRPEAAAEFAAPFGLVRSLPMADPGHRVRLALSVAVLRRGEWAPGVQDPQHIALASEDVVASAERMRALGLRTLEIPDNYYDDLDARLELPAGLLAKLREHSILYDRDERGEFLHFCTPLGTGSRVFFEVVQRIGGYAGYGAANAPVRMAAHRRARLGGAPTS